MSKYDALREYLEAIDPLVQHCTLTFDELQEVLGFPLPASARQYRPWWANESGLSRHTQARGWLDAGWTVGTVDIQARWVRLVRIAPPAPARSEGQSHTTVTANAVHLIGPVSHVSQVDRPSPAKSGTARVIALVSCVGEKCDQPALARDLYISDWFLKARTYAERNADAWYILSAKYGLVPPDRIISPYNVTLKQLPAAERRAWASRVGADLRHVLKAGDRVVLLAGEAYRAGLVDAIRTLGCTVDIPMEGLGIGQQLRWLKQHLE